jgi:hypothetical protein
MTNLTIWFACEDYEQRAITTCVAARDNEINGAPVSFKREDTEGGYLQMKP